MCIRLTCYVTHINIINRCFFQLELETPSPFTEIKIRVETKSPPEIKEVPSEENQKPEIETKESASIQEDENGTASSSGEAKVVDGEAGRKQLSAISRFSSNSEAFASELL